MAGIMAVVLAGGRGKRMDILCNVRPKPALPFAGRFRVIDFSLSNCVHSGIGDIAVLTDYQRSLMADYLNRWRTVNAGKLRFSVLEPQKGSYKGTADAVYQNLDYLSKSDAELVLVLAGDHIYKMDYRKMIDFHRASGADVTVGVVTVPMDQTYRFGTVNLGPDSRITEFVEKSEHSLSNLASMGIYIFNKKILMQRLAEDAARPDSPHDFGYAILPDMVHRDRVFAHLYQGYWQDIGSKDAYFAANMELLGYEPSYSLDSTWHILSDLPDLALMQKTNQGSIKNSLVSPGCVIKGLVENSVLSPGVVVEEKAVVRNSILMDDVNVGYHTVVDRCILDKDVNISQYCYIGFDAGFPGMDARITVVGKGATVPSHTAVGRNCTVLPYVGPADFSGSVVHSGTTLSPHSGRSTSDLRLKLDESVADD